MLVFCFFWLECISGFHHFRTNRYMIKSTLRLPGEASPLVIARVSSDEMANPEIHIFDGLFLWEEFKIGDISELTKLVQGILRKWNLLVLVEFLLKH